MDLSKLSLSDRLICGGAIVYLIAMFLPWYELDAGFVSANSTGWDYFLLGIVPLLLLVVMAASILVPLFSPSTNLPKVGSLSWAQVYLIAGGIAVVLVLLRLLIKDDGGASGAADDLISRGFGLFIAFIAAAVAAGGAFLKFQAKEDAAPSAGGPPSPF